jgi:hypothetical protein
MNFAILKGLHHPLVNIHPDDFDAMCRKGAGCGQTNITQPNYAYFCEVQDFTPGRLVTRRFVIGFSSSLPDYPATRYPWQIMP